MPHQDIKPVAVIILHEPKYMQPITIKPELLDTLKKTGIKHIALLPYCSPKAVSMSEVTFVPYPGMIMEKGIGTLQEALKEKQFTLVNDYTELFKHATSKSDCFRDMLSTLQKNADDQNHPERYVIFEDLHVCGINLHRTDVDMTTAAKALRLRVACENYLYHLHQPKTDANKQYTQEKQKIVGKLLDLAKISTPDSLQQFGQVLKNNRTTLETRRDSNTMIFLKVLLSFFSIGIAVACGLWKIEGERVTQELSNTLNPVA